jgi:hypothetical protein
MTTTIADPKATVTDWRATLPEDLRADPSLAGFKDVTGLAKSYVDTSKMVGSRVAIPGEKATDAERAEFYGKLGRPAKAEEYKLPEGVVFDDGAKTTVDAFLARAHASGLTQKQVEATVGWYAEAQAGAVKAQADAAAASHTEAVATLRKDWGVRYDENVTLARKAIAAFGGEALAKDPRYGDDPVLLRVLMEAGKLVTEDTIKGKGTGGELTMDQAKKDIESKGLDANFMKALHTRNDPGHKAALDEWKRLHALAYPGDQTL